MKHGVLVLHPRAKFHKQIQVLIERLQQDFNVEILDSSFPGQTREIARSRLAHFDGLFFTAGGDGTLHEAVNGWADIGFPSGPRFVPLPLGTGNDFLYSLDKRFSSLHTYLKYPLQRREDVDLGRVVFHLAEGETRIRHFCVGATTGYSALVTQRRAQLANRIPGKMSYLVALFTSLLAWKNRKVSMVSAEHLLESDVFFNFNAANVRHYGGAMISAPNACPFDGALDAVCMKLNLAQVVAALPENFKGRFDRVPNVDVLRMTEPFTVDTVPSSLVQADGEMLGHTPMAVSCLPGRLPILLPLL